MPNFLLTMWDTLNSSNIGILVGAGLGMFAVIGGLAMLSYHYTLGSIKSRTVGDGQHGTARWATDKEICQTYADLWQPDGIHVRPEFYPYWAANLILAGLDGPAEAEDATNETENDPA